MFPLLESNQNQQLRLYAYDYSAQAVKLVQVKTHAVFPLGPLLDNLSQNNPLYADPPVGTIESAVWDLSSNDALPPDLEPGSADIVILIFVMSALHPDEWGRALANINTACESLC